MGSLDADPLFRKNMIAWLYQVGRANNFKTSENISCNFPQLVSESPPKAQRADDDFQQIFCVGYPRLGRSRLQYHLSTVVSAL